MLDSIDRILQQFEISHYGFLPIDEPLACLPDPYYLPWESVIAVLPDLIASGDFYGHVEKIPILDTTRLSSIPEWRRAYVILTFLMHSYVWTDKTPHEILPPNIAIPLLKVSGHLGLPPTATYPALNLWNCGLITDNADITNPENVIMRHTFTGTSDEGWFYAVSVSVEAKGVRAIQIMLECIAAIHDNDPCKVLECLTSFGDIVIELGNILQRMHERCNPNVFYHRIRPFLAGSRGMEKAGLPRGIFYDEGPATATATTTATTIDSKSMSPPSQSTTSATTIRQGSWRTYSGGSNAQSTLVQFLDISLGVRHEAAGSTSGTTNNPINPRQTYLNEMRQYMPTSHRQFLEHFSSISNIREYATSPSTDALVSAAFDRAVDALTKFRDIHIRIVARYIVAPSRRAAAASTTAASAAVGDDTTPKATNIASASSSTSMKREDLKGTGGTNLIAFLKQTRDETRAAKVGVPDALMVTGSGDLVVEA